MPLRRFQPIPRTGQWREQTGFTDPRTGDVLDLTAASLALALYPCGEHERFRDYGHVLPTGEVAALFAKTNDENTGPLRKLPGFRAVEWAFPQSQVATLWPGSYLLIVTATVGEQKDEVLREPIVVLPGGPRVSGNQPYGGSSSETITVVVDGGREG
jgi:hypothetical protein